MTVDFFAAVRSNDPAGKVVGWAWTVDGVAQANAGQAFDETSKTFMSAYISSKYLDSMSILPRFRAIVVGKGSSCDKPIIVNFEQPPLATVSEEPVSEDAQRVIEAAASPVDR